MLFPSQQRAADALRTRTDANAGAVVLRGLSGMGKSTVAEHALQPHEHVVLDAGMPRKELLALRDAVARGVRSVLLAQPDQPLDSIDAPLHPEEVRLQGLLPQEVDAWLEQCSPALTPEERVMVQTYSLGVPLLLKRILSQRPVAANTAYVECAAYLQTALDNLATDDAGDIEAQVRALVAREMHVQALPEDILRLLCSKVFFSEKQRKPLALLTSRLNRGAQMPIPRSPQLLELYEIWSSEHPNEPAFDVLVDHVQNAQEFLDRLGYAEVPNMRTALLGAFVLADSRKGAACAPDQWSTDMRYQLNNSGGGGSENWMNARLLELARASGYESRPVKSNTFGREQILITIPGLPSPLYIHKHDHTPSMVMPVAYVIECELQRLELSYSVRLSDRSYRYDPRSQRYADLPKLHVKYFHEAHGWPLDDDDASAQDVEM